jgi:hypothetical protein
MYKLHRDVPARVPRWGSCSPAGVRLNEALRRREGISLLARSDQRRCLWKPRFFAKNRVKPLTFSSFVEQEVRRFDENSLVCVRIETFGMFELHREMPARAPRPRPRRDVIIVINGKGEKRLIYFFPSCIIY